MAGGRQRGAAAAPVSVSQEAFDAAVLENMEEFDMDAEEAAADAVHTLTLQGADLSGIDTRPPGTRGGSQRQQEQQAQQLSEEEWRTMVDRLRAAAATDEVCTLRDACNNLSEATNLRQADSTTSRSQFLAADTLPAPAAAAAATAAAAPACSAAVNARSVEALLEAVVSVLAALGVSVAVAVVPPAECGEPSAAAAARGGPSAAAAAATALLPGREEWDGGHERCQVLLELLQVVRHLLLVEDSKLVFWRANGARITTAAFQLLLTAATMSQRHQLALRAAADTPQPNSGSERGGAEGETLPGLSAAATSTSAVQAAAAAADVCAGIVVRSCATFELNKEAFMDAGVGSPLLVCLKLLSSELPPLLLLPHPPLELVQAQASADRAPEDKALAAAGAAAAAGTARPDGDSVSAAGRGEETVGGGGPAAEAKDHPTGGATEHSGVADTDLCALALTRAVEAVALALKALVTADDPRLEASKAFGNARALAKLEAVEHVLAATSLMLTLLSDTTALSAKDSGGSASKAEVQGKVEGEEAAMRVMLSLLDAFRALAVNEEICTTAAEHGGVALLVQLLRQGAVRGLPDLAAQACASLGQLAKSDGNKAAAVREGALDALLFVVRASPRQHAAVPEALAAVAAITLRSPSNAAAAAKAGAVEVAASMLESALSLPTPAPVLRQTCWMLRNMAARSPEIKAEMVALGMEQLLRQTKAKNPQCREACEAALRDMGVDRYNE